MLANEDRMTLMAIAMKLDKSAPRAAATLFDIARDLDNFEKQITFMRSTSRSSTSIIDQVQELLTQGPRTFLELITELEARRQSVVNNSSVRVQMSALRELLLKEGKRALVKNNKKQYMIIEGAEAERLGAQWRESAPTPQKTGRILREIREWFRETNLEPPERADILSWAEIKSPDSSREWPFMYLPRFTHDEVTSWIEIQFSEEFIDRLNLARPPVAMEDWLTSKGLKTKELGEFPKVLYISTDP